jgi:hypothetical protein
VKQRRSEEMRAVADDLGAAYRARFRGRTAHVLWEEELPDDGGARRWTGLTGNYLRAELRADEEMLGADSPVRLVRSRGEIFEAQLLEERRD